MIQTTSQVEVNSGKVQANIIIQVLVDRCMGDHGKTHTLLLADILQIHKIRKTQYLCLTVFFFSQANIQNTISGLYNAISGIQQQQANMHVRQDNITSTLECVLSALQELKDYNSTSVGNSDSASSAEKGATGTYIGTKSNRFAREYSVSAHNGVTSSRAEVGPENSISRSLNEGSENMQINLENRGSQGNMTINFCSNDTSGEVRGRSNVYKGRQPRSVQFADNCDYLDITQGRNIQRAGVDRRQTSPVFYGLKLPPFNGKEV